MSKQIDSQDDGLSDEYPNLTAQLKLAEWDDAQYQRNQRALDESEAVENIRLGSRGYWR